MDWITFTMTPRYGTFDNAGMSVGEDYAAAIEAAWVATFDAETLATCFGGEWEKQERSRAPYTDAWAQKDRGVTLFAGVSLNHCCVEISGSGCEQLIEKGYMEAILLATGSRLTRIDVACDIETATSPLEFISETSHKRMRSGGHQRSASGVTEYVGSRKSERFARVYRYNKPHPRAHLLRVEHVFRKDYAQTVAAAIINQGVERVAASAGSAFGWAHKDWDTEKVEGADISITHAEVGMGNTVFWLVSSVAPAFKRLCRDGTISDPEAFLKQFFLSAD